MQTKYFTTGRVLPAQIDAKVPDDLSIVVVIPAMNEPGVIGAMQSILESEPAVGSVEVILVINHPEGASNEVVRMNEKAYRDSNEWSKSKNTSSLCFHVLYCPDLSKKKGGVGLARKIGMDEAALRFLNSENEDGIIACYDADCICETNYLLALEEHFNKHPESEGVSIHYEHQLENLDNEEAKAIITYELHLRYFILAQQWAGFPFAFQTVGSSMAVRASTYTRIGGMNTRKAGEDFYFLQKVIERGNVQNLATTTVYPSSRISDRVPFGTGRAMSELINGALPTTYNPKCFEDVRQFIALVPVLYSSKNINEIISQLPESIAAYLKAQKFSEILVEVKQNTAKQASFEKRLFKWFNAFRLMKYVHYARDNYYPDVPIETALDWLYLQLEMEIESDLKSCLIQLRESEKSS